MDDGENSVHSDSDSDDMNDSSSETESTTYMEEEEEETEEASDSKEGVSSVVSHSSGRKGVKGHEVIDVSGIEHANLQILYILEHLTLDNVHTSSLLLCRYSIAPVCEIL
jgi:hypothetical protein